MSFTGVRFIEVDEPHTKREPDRPRFPNSLGGQLFESGLANQPCPHIPHHVLLQLAERLRQLT